MNKKLTNKRIKEILTNFCDQFFYNAKFDDGFMETVYGCENQWKDDNSDIMKENLIKNYLSWYGYEYVLEDNNDLPNEYELISLYNNNNKNKKQ